MSTRIISLQEAVRLISSDKAKERAEGIEQYKDIFQDQTVLSDISRDDDDGRRWLRTLQALFNCVVNDKSACIKRGSWVDAAPIALRRLKDSAQVVQWMIEKTHTYYAQPVLFAAFSHLTQMLSYGGQLFEPIAVDYLKALRTLLSYQPHIEHLDHKSWKEATSLCFNILLHDDLIEELDGCILENLFNEDGDCLRASQRVSRLLDAEVASCLQILITAPNAPLVGQGRLGVYILAKFSTFLLNSISDTTAHLPTLQGLNHVLAELEINESASLTAFAVRVWPSLIGLWATKSRQLKEQVLISFRILLPFLDNKVEYVDKVASLHKKILEEPEQRFAMQPLALTSIELCSSSYEDAFQYDILRAGRDFNSSDAHTWLALELAADCSRSLYCTRSEEVTITETDSRPSKRRKDEGASVVGSCYNAIQVVMNRASSARRGHDGGVSQVWSLQILLFIVLRHGRDSVQDSRWVSEVLPSLSELSSHSDLELQNWSFLALAALAPYPAAKATCKQLWPTICRRVLQPGTSRVASYASKAILDIGALQQKEILIELESLFNDLESHGPSYPFESVCSFLKDAVSVLCKDIGAVKQQPGEKVLAWLQGTWSPLGAPSPFIRGKASSEVQDPLDILAILTAICEFPDEGPWARAVLRLPAAAAVHRAQEERKVNSVRIFLLTASLPQRRIDGAPTVCAPIPRLVTARSPRLLEVRCLNFLLKGLKSIVLEMSHAEYVEQVTEERLGKALDFAVLCLLFDATFQMNNIQSQKHLTGLAFELVDIVLVKISHLRWSDSDIAKVMSRLAPLLGRSEKAVVDQKVSSAIEMPGKQSGIQSEVLLQIGSSMAKDAEQRQRIQSAAKLIWQSADGRSILFALRAVYDRVSRTMQGDNVRTAQEKEDDLWAGISTSGASKQALTDLTKEGDRIFVADVCISAMICIPGWTGLDAAGSSSQVKEFASRPDSELATLLHSGGLIFEAAGQGKLTFSTEELMHILETIGNDILAEYTYQLNAEAQILSIHFLDATLAQWSTIPDTSLVKDFLKVCSFFIKQLNKGNLVWRVEARLATFLEHFLTCTLLDSSTLRDIKVTSLSPQAIVRSLLLLNGRADMRLRCDSSTRSARLYQAWSQLGEDSHELYRYAEGLLPNDTDFLEQMVSRILFFSNSLVASSEIRYLALYNLLELVLVDETYKTHTESVLYYASRLLGFPDTSSLFVLFSSQLTWALAEMGFKIGSLPPQVLGYTSQKDMLRHIFQPVASMMVAINTESASQDFRQLFILSDKTEKEALLECIPFLVTTDFKNLLEAGEESHTFAQMNELMSARFRNCSSNPSRLITKALVAKLDAITVAILKLYYEPDGQQLQHFVESQDATCAAVLSKITATTDAKTHEPHRPFCEGATVYKSIQALADEVHATLEPATVYCVIHGVVTLIQQERLVNDQIRHLQALQLYVALAHKSFYASPAIIRLLINSCAILFGQVDLVEALWPLVEWTVDQVKMDIPGLSSSVLLMLRHTSRFIQSEYASLQHAGAQSLERISRIVLQLRSTKEGKRAATDIICAWPGEHPLSLTKKRWEISIEQLTITLRATSIVSAAFLNRFVSALQKASREKVAFFSSTTIWTILERLEDESPNKEEQGQFAASLADLLYHCDAHLSSPSSAKGQQEMTPRKSALKAIDDIDPKGLQPLLPLKSWLARQLVTLSRSTDLHNAKAAITALRAIFSQEPQFAGGSLASWPPLDAESLRLLTAFPGSPLLSRTGNRNAADDEEGLQRAQKFSSWICWIGGWICDLTADKLDCAPCCQLSPLVSRDAKFAEVTFAVLLHILLRSDLQNKAEQRLDTVALSSHLLAVLRNSQTDRKVWKIIIKAIVQIRNDSPGDEPLACDEWIVDLDYFLLQRRAAQCKLYATALLFAELEREHGKADVTVEEDDEHVKLALQYEVYSNIEDPDSFYGVTNPDVRDSLVNRLKHEGRWDRLFDFYAAQHESSEAHSCGIATSLHLQGFNRLSLEVDEGQKSAYDAAWKTEKWDLPVQNLEPGTSQTLFSALRVIHRERDVTTHKRAMDEAFQAEYGGLAGANVEANKAAQNSVRDLLGLREVRLCIASPDLSVRQQSWTEMVNRFDFADFERIASVRLSLMRSQRRQLESVLLLASTSNQKGSESIRNECFALLALSREARMNGKLQIAINSITQAQRLTEDRVEVGVEEEFSNLLWDLGDHAIAIEALGNIVKGKSVESSEREEVKNSLPLALARLGEWRATARSHQPQTIRDECFIPAREALAKSSLSTVEQATVLIKYATFAHEQYRTLSESTEGDDLSAFIRYRLEEVDQIEAQIIKTNAKSTSTGQTVKTTIPKTPMNMKLLSAKQKAIKLMELDRQKLDGFEASKKRFRREATRMYASTLSSTEAYDDMAIIRLISLWFENANDVGLNDDLNAWLRKIASWKFLPFVHQISSRLRPDSGSSKTATPNATATATAIAPVPPLSSTLTSCPIFQRNITETVFRMSFDHPFHSLYALFALTKADDVKGGRQQGSKGRGAGAARTSLPAQSSMSVAQQLRKEAAAQLVHQVALKTSQRKRIREWEEVCHACVEWARFDLSVQMPDVFNHQPESKVLRAKSHPIQAKFNLQITRIRDVDVPVMTKFLKVDPTTKYDDITSIVRYSDHFSTAGGLHLPKITACLGSDGNDYKQLFKDKDDLRQDAIMQQVFGILNTLLSVDRAAQRRQLRVRTYIIIPLGPQYGLLEFVEHTQPIGTPFMETHHKYRRKDQLTTHQARNELAAVEGKQRVEQTAAFEAMCRRFPPAFRFHFLERHRVPITLLTNRLQYTRSVATTSIVGYILGLGDRHVSNILLDDLTGEVIHIDFGIAFDQGKLLPIPEQVPFRLTRDLVDGMGLNGVEGVFRRCCQETLRVMREGASVIQTVLQVFKYDPLYDWTQNPVKVIRAQAYAAADDAAAAAAANSQGAASSSNSTLDNVHRRLSHKFQQHQQGIMSTPGSATNTATNNGNAETREVAELLAERAIKTVMEKLSTSLSVEYTVNDLMVQAQDPGNLASIFHGWQAAL
ncbi:hypothetical protein CBS101457_001066 [Exobasidium rhododendri]|nr:hypothetical protein CBS101457_001066 [Exobasidium rhododendri]